MLIWTAALAIAVQATPAAPACRLAQVAGGPQATRLWVYRAPTAGARKTGRLRPGTAVFACAERAGWVWIRYADSRHTCGGIDGRASRHGSTCADGWVDGRRIAMLAR